MKEWEQCSSVALVTIMKFTSPILKITVKLDIYKHL